MLTRLVEILNRPVDDDFFDYPTEHYGALSEANRWYYRQAAMKRPDAFRVVATVAPDDAAGETYTLASEHLGKLRVFTPPGPRFGYELFPASQGLAREGFYVLGSKIYLTVPMVYDPGLYVLWVPNTVVDLDADNDSTLPAFMHDGLPWRAASIMAQKPGSLMEPMAFQQQADAYWRGNDNDPSDSGALGTLIHALEHAGVAGLDTYDGAWWRNIR
jgi:hypothetical protein